ncbi:hypothetical protein CO669_07370 [Bradyrhizobium sp. Y36]|uniref:hypothetical protein n=1 Tax=Bradyrhizobium sp. Y36 TaxID=2035447 RepID=UPI000BEA64E1|nr:hypothetical protein [Bradyrhizobium sp. Y36]PDT91057.1 hypothetical protein CO669_07370 [Bradyrhizobium sp. Y36]
MRTALEEAMTKVPSDLVTISTKAFLAECLLKAAAQGHTNYADLVTAATDHVQTIAAMFS